MSNLQQSEVVYIEFIFDNGLTYEIDTEDSDNKSVISFNHEDSEALLAGNPIGVISSSNISMTLYDITGILNINNEDSPYYGYMRNGVQVNLRLSTGSAGAGPFGTYYVDNWNNTLSDTTGKLVEISAQDKLQYLGNKEIPNLPVYSGIRADQLISNVLEAVGFKYGEYIIDESLNMEIKYGITVGTKVRDFLNEICQVLLARVNMDVNGILRITSAFGTSDTVWQLDDVDIQQVSFRHNDSNIYNKVRVNYRQPGEGTLSQLIEISGIDLNPGLNEFKGLKFNNKSLGIDQIYIESPIKIESNTDINDSIEIVYWNAYQGGMDISINNNSSVKIPKCNIVVEGTIIDGPNSISEADVEGADIKIANVLELYNENIQNANDANIIASNLSNYIKSTNKVIDIESGLTPYAVCGDQLQVNSPYTELNGVYKIISTSTNFGLGVYTKQVTVVALKDLRAAVWDDSLDWDDSLIWNDNAGFIE